MLYPWYLSDKNVVSDMFSLHLQNDLSIISRYNANNYMFVSISLGD